MIAKNKGRVLRAGLRPNDRAYIQRRLETEPEATAEQLADELGVHVQPVANHIKTLKPEQAEAEQAEAEQAEAEQAEAEQAEAEQVEQLGVYVAEEPDGGDGSEGEDVRAASVPSAPRRRRASK